ncbi:hypothetical protein B0H66DRAFT_555667 [Apodospora peruviana]|uniref:FAD-binding PCMH-type domain-containing protein n=1 Tax=Apodospora peruviana TaxID=516989 RepID=A0AAE0IDM5_9PEZI|nr:hypothetical protein B0H66DRAFT_555667 [Apodospora peruviana]
MLVTGGGHGYSWSLARHQAGINLDLGFFNTVQIDPVANTMTIGGSVQTRDVVGALYAAGRELAVGICMCVGYAGFTLGGGIGPYSGLHGIASDSLLCGRHGHGRGRSVHRICQQPSSLVPRFERRRLQLWRRHLAHLPILSRHQRRPGRRDQHDVPGGA